MKLIYITILVLIAFIVFWFFVVVPAERKHHKRKLDMLEKKIAGRDAARKKDSEPN